jgi:N-acetylglutamate synthase-like GNAT family acetyltransferase
VFFAFQENRAAREVHMTATPQLEIRDFETRDCEACLNLFDSNTPQFFAPHERAEFEMYLDDLEERGPNAEYLVLEADEKIVACGGYYVSEGTAGLTWGLVGRDRHGEGFGTNLLRERLHRIARVPNAHEVVLDTTRQSKGFFERFGFEVTKITPDGYGAGLDRVDMRLELNTAARARILETP